MGSARTFLLIGDERIAGYSSLTMGSVLRADAPAKLVRGPPAYPVENARPSGCRFAHQMGSSSRLTAPPRYGGRWISGRFRGAPAGPHPKSAPDTAHGGSDPFG